MSIAERLYQQAFAKPRDPRSNAYRDGVRMCLRMHSKNRDEWRLAEAITHELPFIMGTPEADAWWSGVREGHSIWRRFLEEIDQEGEGEVNV
jgi:hypothetical protein